MSVLELHHQGIISYLFRCGLISPSIVAYIKYYEKFQEYRMLGNGYREAVRKLSIEFKVSETTVKKAVRILERSKSKPQPQFQQLMYLSSN